MSSSSITAISARFCQSPTTRRGLITLFALALFGASGCVGGVPEEGFEDGLESDDAGVASAEAALARGGRGGGLGFSCTNGTCTCDKSIENDCEDMSGVCSDATVDGLITCINGWLTTHCTCTLAKAAPNPQIRYTAVPTAGFYSSAR